MAESAVAAKRRMRRIPQEFRKRNAQSCDRCRKRRCKCVPASNSMSCVSCLEHNTICSYDAPRKTRFYGSVDDLSDRYQCLEAIVKGAFPDEPTANAADLMALGQKQGYAMPDLSDERRQHIKLEDLVGAAQSDLPGADDASRERPVLPYRPVRSDGKSSDPQTRDSSDEEPRPPLVRDAAGNEHYIGPSGTLAFFAQLRQLLETSQSASTAAEHMASAKFTKDITAQALEADASGDKDGAATPGTQSQPQSEEAQSPGSITSAIAQDFTRLPNTKLEDILRQFPPDDILEILIGSYFRFVNDDFPLFHRATFEDEYETYIVQGRQGPQGSKGREKGRIPAVPDWGWLGCLHMIIVFGSIAGPRVPGIDHTALRRRSVAAARSLLPQFLSKSTLSNVRVLLLLALFLHNNNERNAAWNLVGTATRISFALGLHRPDTGPSYRFSEREVRKWVFCTLFAFDQFLASSLGRPSGLHEIDVEVVPPKEGYLDSGTGADARLISVSVKLQGILAQTRTVHLARSNNQAVPSVTDVLESLDAWKREIKALNGLDLPKIKSEGIAFPNPKDAIDLDDLRTSLSWRTPAQLRPILILHIQFHYIGLVATRSVLLRDVTNSRKPGASNTQLSDNSNRCIDHACQLAFMFTLLESFDLVSGVVALDIFYAYCAAMVLLLRLLRVSPPATPGKKTDQSEEEIQASVTAIVSELQAVMGAADKCSSMKRFTKVVESFAEAVTNPKAPPTAPQDQILNQTFMIPQPGPPAMQGYPPSMMGVYDGVMPPGAHAPLHSQPHPHAHMHPPLPPLPPHQPLTHPHMGVIPGYEDGGPHMEAPLMGFFPVGGTFGQAPGVGAPMQPGMGGEDVPMPLYADMEMYLGGYGIPRGGQM